LTLKNPDDTGHDTMMWLNFDRVAHATGIALPWLKYRIGYNKKTLYEKGDFLH